MNADKVFEMFRCCITEPGCGGCPRAQCYTLNNRKVEIPADLALDVCDLLAQLLKEREHANGHWIHLKDCANEGVYCSECHTKMFDHFPMKKKFSQYCGRCGAKMDGSLEKPEDHERKVDRIVSQIEMIEKILGKEGKIIDDAASMHIANKQELDILKHQLSEFCDVRMRECNEK